LEPERVVVGDDNLLVVVHLKLAVYRLHAQLLDLVLVKLALLNVLEAPRDQEVAGRRDNWAFGAVARKVIESGGLEAHCANLEFGNVGGWKLQLLRVGFLLAHAVLKPGLAVVTFGGDDQDVGLGSSQDPLAVPTHLDADDGVLQPRQKSFGVLADLLVESDCAVHAANGDLAASRSGNSAEHRTLLVHPFTSNFAASSQSGINGEHGFLRDGLEDRGCTNLRIFAFIADSDLIVGNKVRLLLNLVHYFSRLQIKVD
jgi:hypothetical protein